jgi:hypothetical protein
MNYENGGGLSPSDVALIQGRNNDGFGGFSGDGCWWIILFLLFAMGGWNNGGFGGGFGGGADGMYPWLSNGQKEIMQNTNDGFNTLQLANQLTGLNNSVQGISTQLCGCCADINQNLCNGFAGVNQTVNSGFANTNQTISSGFANAETAANARQMTNMQQNFNNQIATLQGFNGVTQGFNQIGSQLADCCCENRLASCQTQNIIQNEGNATRFADANNTRDIIESQNRNSQAILDKLCQLELDGVKAQLEAKNDLIGQLRQENLYARGQASQVAQTADIRASQAVTANQLVSELRSCPIPSQPVYGNTPIFTCNGNNGCGCGCGNNNLF